LVFSDFPRFEPETPFLPYTPYSLRKKDEALTNYERIAEKLEELARKLRGLKDAKSLLETYEYVYRSLMIFVPAAVFKSILIQACMDIVDLQLPSLRSRNSKQF